MRGRLLVRLVALPLLPVALGAAGSSGDSTQPPTTITETCVDSSCHTDIVQARYLHVPAARQKCMACHLVDEPREHRFRPVESLTGLCTTCHVPAQRTYLHAPVRDGQCTGCHDPHGADRQLLLRDDPTGGLCLTCHAETAGVGAAHVHAPVATGACILCHEAHASWQPQLLTETPPQLCDRCHGEVAAQVAAARHPHAPAEGDCLACHDAHASDVTAQLHEETPALCYGCHDDVREAIESAPVVHGAVTQAGGCRDCHVAHGSQLPALQRASQTELCLSCHDQALQASDGRLITDMAALLRDNPNHHGPIREGARSACHLPHAAEHAQLLRLSYPADFYADFDADRYALCFECHISEMVTSSEGEGLTRFRDGGRNLHWLHVNRARGRTCRACHEVHASRNPFHMRDAVPYGTSGWSLEINFAAEEDGGSCRPGCHEPKTYVRDRGDALPRVVPTGAQP